MMKTLILGLPIQRSQRLTRKVELGPSSVLADLTYIVEDNLDREDLGGGVNTKLISSDLEVSHQSSSKRIEINSRS